MEQHCWSPLKIVEALKRQSKKIRTPTKICAFFNTLFIFRVLTSVVNFKKVLSLRLVILQKYNDTFQKG